MEAIFYIQLHFLETGTVSNAADLPQSCLAWNFSQMSVRQNCYTLLCFKVPPKIFCADKIKGWSKGVIVRLLPCDGHCHFWDIFSSFKPILCFRKGQSKWHFCLCTTGVGGGWGAVVAWWPCVGQWGWGSLYHQAPADTRCSTWCGEATLFISVSSHYRVISTEIAVPTLRDYQLRQHLSRLLLCLWHTCYQCYSK